jgi:hypothetical protein
VENRDYNGTDAWSVEAVQRRYERYRQQIGQRESRSLAPREHVEGDVRWIFPVMSAVIEGIDAGDGACIELGVEFVESGHKQAFGRILHAQAARALRRASLTIPQVERLRNRILGMLVLGLVPHEYREYAKLVRRIGLGDSWPATRAKIDEGNPYVMKYVRYFERFCRPEGSS